MIMMLHHLLPKSWGNSEIVVSLVEGKVNNVFIKEGDFVTELQPILTIDKKGCLEKVFIELIFYLSKYSDY